MINQFGHIFARCYIPNFDGFLLDHPTLSLYIAVSKTSGIWGNRTEINLNYKKGVEHANY
jgi:hypothetical protein